MFLNDVVLCGKRRVKKNNKKIKKEERSITKRNYKLKIADREVAREVNLEIS